MNTTETNKKFAEFLGSEIEETLKGEKVYCLNLPNKHDLLGFKKEFFLVEELKFHNDWNWLMLVVDKIESLGYKVEIVRHICRIHLSDTQTITISENLTKIEVVYNACNAFIDWYKSQEI